MKSNPPVAGAGVGVLVVAPPAGALPNSANSKGAAAPKLDPVVVESSAAGAGGLHGRKQDENTVRGIAVHHITTLTC